MVFYVLLTVHPGMILVNNHIGAQFFMLYQIATLFLYNFVFVFLYWCVCFAYCVLQNFMFCWPCILVWSL